jgi:isopenicillin-N N-acyltransferase like protein
MNHSRYYQIDQINRSPGLEIGEKLCFSIEKLYSIKKNNLNIFKMDKLLNLLETYCPICLDELSGVSKSTKLPLKDLFNLAFEYEVWMEASKISHRCTGFVSKNPFLVGQTNDEYPHEWDNGKHDVVLNIHAKDHKVLLYTHPGIPAYMGINNWGISVLWQYIDNGDRNIHEGVPTTAIIRELLTQKSLDDALLFLKNVPKCIPNNFIISDTLRSVNVECAPNIFTATNITAKTYCHANHVLHDALMMANDIGKVRPNTTTIARQNFADNSVRECRGLPDYQKLLSTPPVFNMNTLAQMIFVPSELTMHIKFSGENEYHYFKL